MRELLLQRPKTLTNWQGIEFRLAGGSRNGDWGARLSLGALRKQMPKLDRMTDFYSVYPTITCRLLGRNSGHCGDLFNLAMASAKPLPICAMIFADPL